MAEFTFNAKEYFNAIPQPLIYIEDGVICFWNQAAKKALPRKYIKLKKGAPLPNGLQPMNGLQKEINLGDEAWQIKVSKAGKGFLCYFERPGLSPSQVEELVSGLRMRVQTTNSILELLQKYTDEGEHAEQNLLFAEICQGQCHLQRLIEHLDFYRSSYKDLRQIFPPALMNLRDLCNSMKPTLEYTAKLLGTHFSFACAREPVWVYANSYLMRMLIYNIISNSLHAQADIVMQLDVKEERALLMIEDNGRGIKPEKLPDLFSGNAGLHLGLPLCRKIAQLMNGSLLLRSEETGTLVSLSMPLADSSTTHILADSTNIFRPEESYSQALLEFSDMLPANCYGLEVLQG